VTCRAAMADNRAFLLGAEWWFFSAMPGLCRVAARRGNV